MRRSCQALCAGGSRCPSLRRGRRLPDRERLLRRSGASMSASRMASWNLAAAGPLVERLLAILLLAAFVLSRRLRGRDGHRRGARILPGGAAQRRTARLQVLRREALPTIAG